ELRCAVSSLSGSRNTDVLAAEVGTDAAERTLQAVVADADRTAGRGLHVHVADALETPRADAVRVTAWIAGARRRREPGVCRRPGVGGRSCGEVRPGVGGRIRTTRELPEARPDLACVGQRPGVDDG